MDPIGLAAGAVGSAAALGLAVVSATVLGVDALRRASGPPDLGAPFYLLMGGTVAGIVAAGAVAWMLLAPLQSAYRRGGLALVSAFATVVVMLVCIPVNQFLGHAGLAGLSGLALIASGLLGRWARTSGVAP